MIARFTKRLASAVLAFIFVTTAVVAPASARLDEFILDAPYEAAIVEDCTKPVLYRVEKGDCLWKIAHKYGTSMDSLAAANGLSMDEVLSINQVIFVPASASAAPGEYLVQKGDTLWDLSQKFNVSVVAIATANGLNNMHKLKVDQRLIIPNIGTTSYAMSAPVVTIPSRGSGSLDLMWPVMGEVTSFFGMRNGRPHEGLDIAANTGTPIKAARAGKVTFAGHRGTYGLAVIVDHGGGLSTLYAHCSRVLVKPGQNVKNGQDIALVGSTGHSTGPHLHLEVRQNGIPYDPLLFLRIYA